MAIELLNPILWPLWLFRLNDYLYSTAYHISFYYIKFISLDHNTMLSMSRCSYLKILYWLLINNAELVCSSNVLWIWHKYYTIADTKYKWSISQKLRDKKGYIYKNSCNECLLYFYFFCLLLFDIVEVFLNKNVQILFIETKQKRRSRKKIIEILKGNKSTIICTANISQNHYSFTIWYWESYLWKKKEMTRFNDLCVFHKTN